MFATPTVLFFKRDILIFNKPYGLLTHHSVKCNLVAFCNHYYVPLNRLDKHTSGSLVFTNYLNKPALFKKIYLCLTYNVMMLRQRCIRWLLSETNWKVSISYFWCFYDRFLYNKYNLYCVKLITGRKHQIRKQLAFYINMIDFNLRYNMIFSDFCLHSRFLKLGFTNCMLVFLCAYIL